MRTADAAKKNESGVYYSQKVASEKYEQKIEQLTLRVPAGTRELLKVYVQKKAEENPENPKYNSYNGKAWRPSVNALITYLIEEETGIKISDLPSQE